MYQLPHTPENYGGALLQTVSRFARPVEIISLIAVLPGPRCTTKHRLPRPDRLLFWTPAVKERREGEGEDDTEGQRQAGTWFRRAFARGRQLELGGGEGSSPLGNVRGVPPPTCREVYKSRDGFRHNNKFIKEDLHRSVSDFFYRDCDHLLMNLLMWQ
jgi:hypothetical protein